MYTAERGTRTYVSDSALVLAKHLRARPSRLGQLTFLRAGYHFGAMTSWEGIARLDPGACISFTPSGSEHARGAQRCCGRPCARVLMT